MKTWFVTGATRGLGLATARAALAAGDQVVATGRNRTRIEAELAGGDDRLLALALDVTDTKAIEVAVTKAAERFGRIDVLVNNAGYGQIGAFEQISAEAIERQFATNVFGVFAVTRAVLPIMRAQRSGHLITISSMAGVIGINGGSVYCASKFAVAGWSESLSLELKRFGIHATVVHPGYFSTDFLDRSSVRHADLEIADYARPSTASTRDRGEGSSRRMGDPAAFGRAMVQLANTSEPPVRLSMGSDAVQAVNDKAASMRSVAAEWLALSRSADTP